ncbi:MAG: hypothetical protein ABH951_01965, partial [Patescibacteria group bacterium]
EYYDCTGVVAIGVDKETGENVSFLSHQNPAFFVENKNERKNFREDFIESMKNLRERCVPSTVDVVIFGGQKEKIKFNLADDGKFIKELDYQDESLFVRQEFDVYKDSIRYLNYFISNEVGFSPVVMTGPNDNFNTDYHALAVYFDNKNRRLHLIRPKQDSVNNESFMADEGENQVKKIKEK